MKKIALLLVLVSVTAFTHPEPRWPRVGTEYLRIALKMWIKDMRSLKINYSRLERVRAIEIVAAGPEYGRWNGHMQVIQISKAAPQAGAYSVVGLLYHELGHAVFGLGHSAEGVMRERSYREEEWKQNWPKWRDQYLAACAKAQFNND